jgi:thiol-disulfide isomerase/thioredoxin
MPPQNRPGQLRAHWHQAHSGVVLLYASAALGVLMLGAAPSLAGETPPAPSFTVRGLDGKPLRLSEFRGRPMVVDFWATWCTPCRANMPHLDRIQQRYRDRGLVVLGLSVDDESPVEVRHFADHLGVRFRLAMANDAALDQWGPVRSLPTTVFIGRHGEIVRRVVGYVDAETMDGFAAELLVPRTSP